MRGMHWILNVPAGTDGLLPANYTTASVELGAATRGLRGKTVAARNFTSVPCPGSLTLPLAHAGGFNAVARFLNTRDRRHCGAINIRPSPSPEKTTEHTLRATRACFGGITCFMRR